MAWQANWRYSRSRGAWDEKALDAQEPRACAVVDGDTVPNSNGFVTVTA
ncbi:hypothetical protein OMK68_19660 [Rhodococcus pyridinivorans]|nr:hypothetical protein [Rhodococcus pyridinivorans]MCW3471823.1 hypothetical protein [Rhodococcus pyridinivorans]